jgi:HK97 family phage major capsid protein
MPNVVLDRLREQRDEQISTIDAILGQVGEERDLVDAERNLLEAARQRINEIDAQIEPLAGFEALRGQHNDKLATLPRPEPTPVRSAAVPNRPVPWSTPGEFLVDYMRANGYMDQSRVRDEAAAQRIAAGYQMRADQTTADTPGLLPTPIVGQVVSLIDANRPLITSLGGTRALGGIAGTSFTRPKITTHTQVGLQTAEKTALPSRKMTITAVPFTKATYGGYVDISRQDMDWSQPSAWDILVRDLADTYAVQTEGAVAAAFGTAATGTKPPALPATPVLGDWAKGLYTAAMHSYNAGLRMPDRIWCSLDVWAALGSLVDTTRVVLPPDSSAGSPDTPLDTFDIGGSSLADFRGDVLGLPRVVCPQLVPKTCIVGPSTLYEAYEEVVGLLSVIEPSILGVQVAYGGYLAMGSLGATAFVALDLSAVTSLPTMAEDEGDEPQVEAVQADVEEPGSGPGTPRRRKA